MGQPVVAGFSTHPDWDHVLWHAELGEAPRYGTARGAAFMRDLLSDADWKDRVAEGLPPEIAEEIPLDLFGLITGSAGRDGADPLGWPQVRIIEHPAHAQGHAALLIEERGVLVAGDMLSDILIPFPDLGAADPIEDYLVGLRLLEGVADDVDVVIPGHGSVGGADRYAHGSIWIARTCMRCVTARLPTTRASAHRPRSARIGCPPSMSGNDSNSPQGDTGAPVRLRGTRSLPTRSARQRVGTGRRDQPLRHPVVDVVEPVVEPATIELDGCPQ